MWESILEALSQVTLSRGARDDDGVDQMHHFATVAILAAFAGLVGMNQYVGDPIHCWVPAEFPDSHQDYTENLCWVSQMYYVPMDEPIPLRKGDRMLRDISFYRWVVVILLIQCLMFKFPNILWKELKGYSGINIHKIVNMAEEAAMTPPEEREKKVKDISIFIDRWLESYRVYKYNVFIRMREKVSGVLCFAFGKRHGTYLTGLYLFTKILYLVNVIGQFFLLTRFLGFDFYLYGFDILANLNNHGEFRDFDHFPRVVMCDIEIRQLQNLQTFSTQCVLAINLFIEKIFAIVWFWLFVLTIASIINVGHWIFNIFFQRSREHFIQKYLIMLGLDDKTRDRKLFKKFVSHYLRDDGVFLLRSVGNNSSDIILLDLVKTLWTNFKKVHGKPAPDLPIEPTTHESFT
ncbi:innexin unc-9-like [Littorina saxatilis]|uniref:innexin unc-9-like n=1 Tax=Littorina saxatilis TaxID=31220 RepID=UPI0038B5F97E